MPDQNNPQNPPAGGQTPPNQTQQPVTVNIVAPSNQAVEAAGTGFLATVKALWSQYSIFFIIVGIVLLIAKFGDVITSVLTWWSKKTVEDAQKKDNQLKAEESAANQQANDLVKKANELPSQEGQVDENWNRKK